MGFTYFFVLTAIAQMWAPSSNSQRYAYHDQLSSLDDDEDYKAAAGDIELAEKERVDAEYIGGLDDTGSPFRKLQVVVWMYAVQFRKG